jgi:membrane-associated protease RseP (regulator of RpoE activity)
MPVLPRIAARKRLFVASCLFVIALAHSQSSTAKPSDKTEVRFPVIIEVFPKLPAEAVGIKSGDQVISVNDEAITRSEEFIRLVHLHKGSPTKIQFKNGTSKVVVPSAEGRIGVRISDLNDAIVKPNRLNALSVVKRDSTLATSEDATKAAMPPVYAQLSPGTHIKVLIEQTANNSRANTSKAVCVFQLPIDNPDVHTGKITKGDWITPSEHLQPANGAAHHVAKSITLRQGELLKADMTLPKIREILGAQGDLVSRSKFKDVVAETWIWQNADGSYLCCNFENNKLTYKSGFLLQ